MQVRIQNSYKGNQDYVLDAQCNRIRDHDWWHISCTDPKDSVSKIS